MKNPCLIAILGYGSYCSDFNKRLAEEAGKKLAMIGYDVCAGNISGTFLYAFQGAKSIGGKTVAIVDDSIHVDEKNRKYCDRIITVKSTLLKHKTIADKCDGAIVIGGGKGTLSVIKYFLLKSKPVVAIKNTGGVVESDLDNAVQLIDSIESAINFILSKAST